MVRKINTLPFKLGLLLLAAGAILMSPGTCVSPAARPALRMQLPYEPATLDYSTAEDGAALRVLSSLMVGLVSYDRDYRIRMEIAERMEKLDGGRRYRFRLRPWKWSDGRPVVSGDFAYAMRRTLEPGTPAKLADLLFFIKGARAYKRGETRDFATVGIKAPAPDVLEFELDAPISFFPHILTLPVGFPQRADVIARFGAQWPEHLVSTGPYQLVRWLHDQRIEIEQSPSYPGFAPEAPREAVFQIVPEEATAVNLFENDRLDVLFKVPSFDLDRLRRRGVVREFPYFATYYLAFDQRQAPWNDRRARLAVAQAINRKAILEALGGNEHEASSWIPRGLPGHNAALGVEFDPARAKATWKTLGVRSARPHVLGFDTSFRNQTVVERIQADLKETLGLKLQLLNRDWKTYLRDLAVKPPAMYRFGWLSPFVDAYANLVIFQSGNPNNYTGWRNKSYDSLVRRIATLDPGAPERQRLVDRAQRILLEEAVTVVPIFHYLQTIIVAPRVRGFWVNGMGMVDYMKVRMSN